MIEIRALTFDTGGTVLDWHGGISRVLADTGARHGITADWAAITNEYRRRSLQAMIDQVGPHFNMDDVHRGVLDLVLRDHGLEAFDRNDREQIWRAWHELDAWPDFADALRRLRRRYIVGSFTILTTSLVIDVSRRNRLDWDCIISCEMLGIYKTNPTAYVNAARLLQLPPETIMMVACHNFDLMAARRERYHSAFVRRPREWGPAQPPDPEPNAAHDLVVDDFGALADRLGC
ncbi:MAG TPA: HAD-IA family hydrolase [Burkholderiaceae bacterium]|jgi:2-haloacid dehalogenase|nr:HAD-IA family hydrolase [Burkholderiaceae bacterium]